MGRRPCCEKEGLNRGAWTAQEDQILTDYIRQNGEGRWRNLPNKAGLKRCGKSCRLRWLNYLRPDIKRGNISPDEEELIIRLHKLLGNRWSLIAGRLPGRTDNEIKNYWNTNLVKKVQQSHQLPLLIPNATPSSSQISPNDEKTTGSGLVRTRASRSSNEVFVAAQLANPDAASPSTRTTTAETATDPRQPNLSEEDHNNTDNSNLTDLVLDFNIGDLCLSDLLDSSDLSSPSPACSCDHQPDALFYETGEASNNTMLDFNVQPFVPFLGYYTEGEWLE